MGANLLSEHIRVAGTPVALTAAIDTSNTTVGFADSTLYALTPADVDRTLDEMQAMGVENVRIIIPWGIVEPVPGYYNWSTLDYIVNAANQRNMGILGAMDSTPYWAAVPDQPPYAGAPTSPEAFADFAGQVAQRYAGEISAYEVWNEPNTVYFWAPKPDPAAYTELLQAAYPAIKTADPNATVIAGVLMSTVGDGNNLAWNPVSYLQAMYADGAQGYFDALSFHPYQYTLPFSQGGPYGDASAINQMSLMHQLMVQNGDGDKLIWATEYGEPTSGGGTESMQASFISDFLNSWSQIPYAGPSFIYTTRDTQTGSTNPEDTFGVLRTDWTWKPAAFVIQQWTATHPQWDTPLQLTATISPVSASTTTPLAAPDPATTTDPVTASVTTTDPVTTFSTTTASPTTATGSLTADPPASTPMTLAAPTTTATPTGASTRATGTSGAGTSTTSDATSTLAGTAAPTRSSTGTSGLDAATPIGSLADLPGPLVSTTGSAGRTSSSTSTTGTTGSTSSSSRTGPTSSTGSTSRSGSTGSAASSNGKSSAASSNGKSSASSTSGSAGSKAGTGSPKH